MSFKKLRGVKLSRNRQGYIRFTCLTYADQPQVIRDKISKLCSRIGGDDYAQALWEMCCTEENVTSIAMRHCVSESQLYKLRKQFFESWFRKGQGNE